MRTVEQFLKDWKENQNTLEGIDEAWRRGMPGHAFAFAKHRALDIKDKLKKERAEMEAAGTKFPDD